MQHELNIYHLNVYQKIILNTKIKKKTHKYLNFPFIFNSLRTKVVPLTPCSSKTCPPVSTFFKKAACFQQHFQFVLLSSVQAYS